MIQYSKDEFKVAIVASMHLVEGGPPHIPACRSVLAPPARCKLERHGQRGRRDKAEQRGRYPLRNMRAKTNNDVRACPLGGNGAGPHPRRTRQSTSTLRATIASTLLAWKLMGLPSGGRYLFQSIFFLCQIGHEKTSCLEFVCHISLG